MAADNEPSELDVLGDLAVPVEVGSNDTEGERKGFHMVNVNLNIASRTPYMPPAITATSPPGTDFGTELKTQSDPAAITTATTIAAATTTGATTTATTAADTAPAFGMIGTATPWSPTTAVTSPAAVTSPPAPTD